MSLFEQLEELEFSSVVRELEREIEVKKSLYPKWVEQKKIDFQTAEHRIKCLEKVLEIINKTRETK